MDKNEKLTAKRRNINACIVGFRNKNEKLTLGMIIISKNRFSLNIVIRYYK